jgi:nicotinamide riboside kinase
MKIAIIGTHGTGKTTLAYRLCSEAKKRGKNAVILSETARSCPFPINEGSSLDGFFWMTGTQLAKEQLAVAHKSDYIVCDRSVIDHVAYVPLEFAKGKIFDYMVYACTAWLDTYDKIFWVIPSPKAEIAHDGIRCTDPEFQEKIHHRFENILSNLPYSSRIREIESQNIFDDKLDFVINEAFKPIDRSEFTCVGF